MSVDSHTPANASAGIFARTATNLSSAVQRSADFDDQLHWDDSEVHGDRDLMDYDWVKAMAVSHSR